MSNPFNIKFIKNLTSWLFMIPSILLFTFYVWYPLLAGIRYSFFKMVGFKIVKFVGLDNYIHLVSNKDFIIAFKNTFTYAFWSIVLGYLVPIVIAIFLNELIHFKGLFRLGIYFPNIVPAVATYMMWNILMSPSEGGVFNTIIISMGFEPSNWLQDPKYSIPMIIVTMTWRAFGGTVLIYMASLQTISQDLYEAASVDGAGIWIKIRHITLPSILPLAKMLLLLQFIAVFQVMQEPLIMTDGGPLKSSTSLLLLNYFEAFRYNRIDKAATIGGLVSIMLFVISFIYLRITKSSEEV
ncbi:MAG: sugar ABC transporter permease [Vallitaleaceae bacterium]|nr:sugar ABC transporter permease [Vallitaleaceae bacterium]